jgi:hypothetical protein
LPGSTHHVRVLIPRGWNVYSSKCHYAGSGVPYGDDFKIASIKWFEGGDDRRWPFFLRWLEPSTQEYAWIFINSNVVITPRKNQVLAAGSIVQPFPNDTETRMRHIVDSDGLLHVEVIYHRENLPAFNRTYRQICNSLRIE